MTNFGKRITIRQWMDLDRPILRECDEEIHEMLERALALVEAARRVADDYTAASSVKYDERKWAEFAGTDEIAAALAAMKEAGDID